MTSEIDKRIIELQRALDLVKNSINPTKKEAARRIRNAILELSCYQAMVEQQHNRVHFYERVGL